HQQHPSLFRDRDSNTYTNAARPSITCSRMSFLLFSRRPSSGSSFREGPPSPRNRGEGLPATPSLCCPSPRLRGEGAAKRRVRGRVVSLLVALGSLAFLAQAPNPSLPPLFTQ